MDSCMRKLIRNIFKNIKYNEPVIIEEQKEVDFEKMSKQELIDFCEKNNIKIDKRNSKQKIINKIKEV